MTGSISGAARSAVAIMAKAPTAGDVKTRLCPPLSHQAAAALYRSFLLDKIAQVNSLQQTTAAVAYSPNEARQLFEALIPARFALVPQRGPDLGARLLSTFEQLFDLGYTQVLVIDSDTPTLPVAYLDQGLRLIAAQENDVVLGPTEDGGYYLIGLRLAHRALFEAMPWSTPLVLDETSRRASQRGLKVVYTEPWYDVDTPDDLARLQASLVHLHNGVAHHTRQFLRGFRL